MRRYIVWAGVILMLAVILNSCRLSFFAESSAQHGQTIAYQRMMSRDNTAYRLADSALATPCNSPSGRDACARALADDDAALAQWINDMGTTAYPARYAKGHKALRRALTEARAGIRIMLQAAQDRTATPAQQQLEWNRGQSQVQQADPDWKRAYRLYPVDFQNAVG